MAEYDRLSCELLLTSKCNLACSYCIAKELPRSTMNLEFGKKAVDLFLMLGQGADNIDFTFTGGEPLLVFHQLRLITQYINQTCQEADVEPSYVLKTNGTILNPSIIQYIQTYNVKVVVSIDGNNTSHNKFRRDTSGIGTYSKVSKNISTLIQNGIPCVASITIHPDECDLILNNVKHLCDLGVKNIDIGPAYGTVIWDDAHSFALSRCLFGVADYIKMQRERGNELDIGPLHQITDHINGKLEHCWGCAAGLKNLAFLPNGDIVGCSALAMLVEKFPDLVIGNVHSGIDEVSFSRFEKLARAGLEERLLCNNCNTSHDCAGGCMAINLSVSGLPFTPPQFYCQTLSSIPKAWEIAWQSKILQTIQ
jgi:uncharacterized protein